MQGLSTPHGIRASAPRLGAAWLLAAVSLTVQAQTYALEPLPPTDLVPEVRALNNTGTAVGAVMGTDYTRSAAVWTAGGVQYLVGPLPNAHAFAFGVNDAGVVVGESSRAGLDGLGPVEIVATRWVGGRADTLPLAGRSWATDINESGAATVILWGDTGVQSAVWTGSTLVTLAPLNTFRSLAYGINNAGVVVGSASSPTDQAAIWEDGSMRLLDTLATRPCDMSTAYAVNDARQVVGECMWRGPRVSYTSRPFVWNNGTMTDLSEGLQGSGKALGQNEQGQIVGNWNERAMLWDHGLRIDLNSRLDPAAVAAGFVLNNATDINDRGQITAIATNTLQGGHGYAVLLSPVSEPAAAWLLLAGLGTVAGAWRVRGGRGPLNASALSRRSGGAAGGG